MDKTLAIRIDPNLHKQIKMRITETEMTLKEYVVCLIENDLKNNTPLTFENTSADTISEESIEEAQKVLDYVRNIIMSQKIIGEK